MTSRSLLRLVIPLILSGIALGAPPNDDCENATPITGEGIYPIDLAEATTDGPADCFSFDGDHQIESDVWFSLQVTREGNWTFETCGGTTLDTKMAVGYVDCVQYGAWECSDDACAAQSRVTLDTQAFVPGFHIRVGVAPATGSTGEGTLLVRFEAPVDRACDAPAENCQVPDHADAFRSDGANYRAADNFVPATNGSLTEVCWSGAYSAGNDECWPGDGDAFEIRYYLDEDGAPGPLIAGPFRAENLSLTNDSAWVTGQRVDARRREVEYHANHAPVPVLAGQCYWIEIVNRLDGECQWQWETAIGGDGRAAQDGHSGIAADGYDIHDLVTEDLSFCLNLPLGPEDTCVPYAPVNDDCVDSIPISEGVTSFDNLGATTDGPAELCDFLPSDTCCDFPLGDETVQNDIWYDYTASCTGLLRLDLCESSFDTKIAVYDGADCPTNDRAIACNDDSCSNDPGFYPPPQTSAMAGASDPFGQSDCFSTHDSPGCDDSECSQRVCTVAPFCCESLWYPSCADMAAATCLNTRVPGWQSTVELPVTQGRPYKIRVGGYGNSTGIGTMAIEYSRRLLVQTSLVDYAEFALCFTGSCPTAFCAHSLYHDPCCARSDFDSDGDVDVTDFEEIHRVLTGP